MFKRRRPLSWWDWLKEQVYPKRGFKRQIVYIWHRLRRLPDPPHRIARGVFAGTFVNFPPILGIQMISAATLAWVMRGNIIAALLATFLSNPITTPVIAYVSLELGHWMLGLPGQVNLAGVFDAFAGATSDLWFNVLATFGPEEAHWGGLRMPQQPSEISATSAVSSISGNKTRRTASSASIGTPCSANRRAKPRLISRSD